MDNIIPILSLLIITGLFVIGFVLSVFFKRPSLIHDKDEKMEIVVAHMIESLRKVCPVGAKKGWTLIPVGCSSPRSWTKRFAFPDFKSDIVLHGSSVIVKSTVSIIKDLISKPSHWDEWDSSYFSSSMNRLENDSSNLKRDTYMNCVLIGTDKKSFSQDTASMFCFKNMPSDKARWIFFWSIMSLDWWFFLIQPAMRKQDLNNSLLTIIRGTDTAKYENKLAKAVWIRIRNIKEAAELHSFKVFPFDPLLEYSSAPCRNLAEPTKHPTFCKKRSHTESCGGNVSTGGKMLPENSADMLLQIVSSSGCEVTTPGKPKKFNVRMFDASVQECGNSSCDPQAKKRCNTAKKLSSTTALSGSESSGGDSKQLLQEVSSKLQTENMRNVANSNSVLPERLSRTNRERSNSSVTRSESNISRSKSNSGNLQDVSSRAKECDPGQNTKRKSFVESIRRVSGILSSSSNLKSDAGLSKCVVNEPESHTAMRDETSDSCTAECAGIRNGIHTGNSTFYDSDMSRRSNCDLTENTSGCETVLANESISSFSNDKSATCEGNCSPICEVCLEVAFVDLSDFEVLLPYVRMSEERIADLLTKGNYCAAELQAEVHEASQVKACSISERKNSNGKWTRTSSTKDIDLYLKTKEESSLKIMSYLCQANFSASPETVWNIIRSPRCRFICDETTKKVTVVEELPEQQKIVYTYHEFGGLLKKETMDFCLLHSERVEDSKYSMSYSSVEYESCPLSTAVRGMLFPSGWVIEKLKGNSDKCKVSYLTQVVVNRPDSLLIQESSNIVLQSIQNLLTYCTSAPESIRSPVSK